MKAKKQDRSRVVIVVHKLRLVTDRVGPLQADSVSVPGHLLLYLAEPHMVWQDSADVDRAVATACRTLTDEFPHLTPTTIGWCPAPEWSETMALFLSRRFKAAIPPELESTWDALAAKVKARRERERGRPPGK